VIVLSEGKVRELLDLDELVDALADAHRELSAGEASMPPRIAAFARQGGLLGVMPAYLPSAGLACKLVTLFPQNTDRHTHQAVIVVFDPENGTPLAIMDGTYITATRTAAGSALATRLLARKDAEVLALLGTGVQARSHARALPRVRAFSEIRVAGRDRARAEALAEEIGPNAHAVSSYEEAIRGADVVAATTHALEPIVRREWLSPGVHVNSVGLNPSGREVDEQTVADALLVVESRESALAPPPAGAPELVGVSPADVHAELGELVAGTKPGRTSPDEITLYKSVGVAVQDVAAAALVLAAAKGRSVGRAIDLEELR
jgi:ornithine cyclodeaminase/alanine dehydrogenase-like protein (mu-crystallin family)